MTQSKVIDVFDFEEAHLSGALAVGRVIPDLAGVHVLHIDVVCALLKPYVIPSVQSPLVPNHRHHVQLLMESSVDLDSSPKTTYSVVPDINLVPYPNSLGIVEGKAVIQFRIPNPLPQPVFYKAISDPDGGLPDNDLWLSVHVGAERHRHDIRQTVYHLSQETKQESTSEAHPHLI